MNKTLISKEDKTEVGKLGMIQTAGDRLQYTIRQLTRKEGSERRTSNMHLKVAPMFLVENVDEAVEWYKEVFGAKLQAALPKEPPYEWASLRLGDVEIMFSLRDSAQKWYSENAKVGEKPANFILYIYIGDANGLYERIKNRVKIIMEPVDQWYGIREFAIEDPFGIILVFAQMLK